MHARTRARTHARTLAHSFAHSLAYSLARSLTLSATHSHRSFPHSPAHTLTHSLFRPAEALELPRLEGLHGEEAVVDVVAVELLVQPDLLHGAKILAFLEA
jgi:hypothetical protein